MRNTRPQFRRRASGRCRRLCGLSAVVAVALLAAACGSSGGSTRGAIQTRSNLPRSSAAGVSTSTAVAATDALAVALYRRLGAADGNVVFSPLSLELALAMARNGAKGETRAQMDRVLGSPGGEALDTSLNALTLALESRSGSQHDDEGRSGEVALSLADQVWSQTGLPIEQPFLDVLARDYGAGLAPTDFDRDLEAARQAINRWASDQTHGRIRDLIPRGGLPDPTAMVLANAIYFKAPWGTDFSMVGDRPFIAPDGSTHSVPTMTGGESGAQGRAGEGDGWKAVELPYLGDELSMVVIQPDDLHAFERTLDGAELASITSHLDEPLADVQLPTFRIHPPSLSLGTALASMGMPLAFSDAADFSGITRAQSLKIAEVFHQAYVDVDEHGTEAAAATGVVMVPTAAPIGATVVIDHPFLFAIRDRPTGAILFLGRVTEP
jgi:serpin B